VVEDKNQTQKEQEQMKGLLISPPVTFHRLDLSFPAKSPLLALTYIGAALKGAMHEVKILDCVTSSKCNYHIDSKFTRYSLSDDEILENIRSFNPDVVGISCMYTSNFNDSHNVVRIVKTFLLGDIILCVVFSE
jgi:hypothetical protein